MREKPKSPIREEPLRLPGQSLQEELDDLWDDKLESWALTALFLVMLAAWQWFELLWPMPPQPVATTIAALAVLVFVAYRVLRLWPRLKALRLGIKGERVVGEYLERLRARGYRVFHDVVARDFNIDHALVGPGGVFTVETKTRSKPAQGDARVVYDGETIKVAGFAPDRDPIAQAKGQARWLAAMVADTTERKVFVRPVVVFPGWYVEAAEGSQRQVWVLEPKGLPAFIEREADVLSKADIALIAKSISMHVRANERKR